MWLTLSPVTGRRPLYTIFIVDIGVTDVTKNCSLFAVISTTCSTLLKELVVAVNVFSTRRHQPSTTQSSTPSQFTCRFGILATKKALYSHKLRARHTSQYTRYQVDYIHTRYTHACGVCGLFSLSMAAGLLAFSRRQFALTIEHGPSLRSLHTIFPS